MKRISTTLIAGAGAIGSMVAWELFQANKNAVSILAGGERLARYREGGFVVNGTRYDFRLTDVNDASVPDLVIIACKAHHLAQVLEDLRNHVGPETLTLSLLNGISSERIIADVFGEQRVPLSMIIGTDAGHLENKTRFSKTGTIFFGENENPANRDRWSPRVAAIANFFDQTGVPYSVPGNMLNRLWYKFMLNVGVNQVTATARRPYKAIQSATIAAETRELLDGAMREVIEIAKAEGITLNDDDIASVYRTMDALSPEGKTSMCQDVEAGRKTEVELFAGTVIELGKKHGIPVPVNAALFNILRTIEQSY